MLQIKQLLAPPLFAEDDKKTRRARLLNHILLTLLVCVLCLIMGNLAGGRVPAAVTGLNVVVIVLFLVLRHWNQQGRVKLAGAALMAIGLLIVTTDIALLGTIRTPSTAVYILLVVTAGLLFEIGGMIAMVILCSLLVGGLSVAENSGWLPRPDYTVTITQWVTYTVLFLWAGSLTSSAILYMRQALAHASLESTERRQAEQALKATLAEKEVLMREIHHRVKNNMQMMSALLELQSGYVQDAQALGYFRDSQQRIQSMALIHEQLYHNKNLAQIDFAAYLNTLVASLRGQYCEQCKQINVRIDAGRCILPVDVAIPCGLVISELVSNVFKYAFPNGEPGELSIAVRLSAGGKLVLEIGDNGVGLPPGFDLNHSNSFGLRVVKRMIEGQLDGKLVIESNHGTKVLCEIGVPK
jgi:two-component sensor histidine kinase/drug/metabolite transporter superfamily protein YnfA